MLNGRSKPEGCGALKEGCVTFARILILLFFMVSLSGAFDICLASMKPVPLDGRGSDADCQNLFELSGSVALEVGHHQTLASARKQLARFQGYSDARIVQDQTRFSVRLGRFCQSVDDLPLLLSVLKKNHPGGSLVSAQAENVLVRSAAFQRVTLEDLGFQGQRLMEGGSPYFSATFPWALNRSFRGSRIVLKMAFSPLLAQDSTVRVMVNGVPLQARRVDLSGDGGPLSVSLDALEGIPASDRLILEVRGYFHITDDRCRDEQTGNLWARIASDSFLESPPRKSAGLVGTFLDDLGPRLYLAATGDDQASAEAALRTALAVGTYTRNRPLDFRPGNIALDGQAILIGPFKKDMARCGDRLYLTPEGARLFVSKFHRLMLSPKLDSRVLTVEEPGEHTFPFSVMGTGHRSVRGAGDLVVNLPFSVAAMGGYPEKLTAFITYAHSPVSDGDRAHLKIKLNNLLVDSREVRGESGIRTATVTIPNRYLAPDNLLQVIFSYYTESGDCRAIPRDFEATVFSDSHLLVAGRSVETHGGISNFPGFLSGEGTVTLSGSDTQPWPRAARLLFLLGNRHGGPATLHLRLPGEAAVPDSRFRIMVGVGKDLAQLSPTVDTWRDFSLFNPQTRETLFSVTASSPFSVLQTFVDPDGLPTLAMTVPEGRGHDELTLPVFKRLRGNVAVLRGNDWYTAWVGEKIRVAYPGQKDAAYYWNRYRLPLVLGLGFLSVMLIVYILRNLTGKAISDDKAKLGAMLLIFALCLPEGAQAGAWVREKGQGFASLQVLAYTTRDYFPDLDKDEEAIGRFTKYEFNPYIEYGLTQRDTLIMNLFLNSLTRSGNDGKTFGLNDVELGWRHRLNTSYYHIFSSQLTLLIPTSYSLADDPRLGFGRLGGQLDILYGHPFKVSEERFGFVDLSLGYRVYDDYPSDQVRALATVGVDLTKRFQLLTSGELHLSMENGQKKQVGFNVILPSYHLLKLTLSGRYRLRQDLSLVVGGFVHAWGEDTGAGGGGVASLWIDF